ncbi:MAG: RHS repeat protein [Kiritimatiellae bacterium]|nr:RHS repeat protein [Kiritimatiellia bacterium]
MRRVLVAMSLAASMAANAAFYCNVRVPSGNVGVSRKAIVTYSNSGTSSIAAPYVRLEAGDDAYVRFSESDVWAKSVEFLATSGQLPASSLRAGETVEVPVFVRTDLSDAQLTLSYMQSSTAAFPWGSIGSSLKPSYVTDSAWTFAIATLKSRLGTTWNTYLSCLRYDADYLAENGRPVRQLDHLLQVEINRALGVDAVLPVLASATDAARSARGMGLSFTRSYSSAMYGRFASGILGYGWTDNLSTYVELTDAQTLVFRVPGGGSYSFTKATGSWQPEDSRDKTVLTESSSAYTLTYQSGTVQTFAKSNMRTSSIADNCGNSLTFTWNGTKLQKISHTDGQSLTFAYSSGLLASVTDDCGRKTTYAYSNSLLTEVTTPDGLVTSYEYRSADGTAAARALSRIIYPDGTKREFAYDTSSGLVTVITANGGKEKTSISRNEGIVTLTGPDGAATTVKTGVSGEVLETADALGGVVEKGYTEDGLLKSVVSPSGLTGTITHDALGRVSKSVSAAGSETTFAYEETFGNLKRVTDANSRAITYGYDTKGHGTSVTFADGSASKLEYNSRGDVVKSTNRRGQSVAYSYDGKGRLVKKTWSSGRTFTYDYDAHGNVTKAADSETGTVTMQYDSADRLTRIEYPTGRGFTFAYDSCGRLATRTSLDGAVERFAYDAAGRLASVKDGNGKAYLQNTYNATTGRLSKQVNGNGTSVSYLYDKLGHVASIEHCDANGKIAESFQYCYDADGRCLRASSLLGEERYAYDKDGQLTAVEYPNGTGESFSYDAVGNRTSANGATYTVNNLNQYTRVAANGVAATLSYDLDGNLTKLTDANGATTYYYYDTLNRLVAVTNAAAGVRWSCAYDVFGNRVSVTDNGVTTERTYLQGSLPSVAAEYVNGELTERHIVVGAVRLASLSTHNSQRSTSFYHADLIGSTRLVTDGNGAIVDRRAYTAFGGTRIGNETDSTAGYVGTLGVETDPTGLLFMRNRYYFPALGRFIQMDPIGLSGEDVNLYRYCDNNPIVGIDPNGEFVVTLAGAIAFMAKAALAYGYTKIIFHSWEQYFDLKINGDFNKQQWMEDAATLIIGGSLGKGVSEPMKKAGGKLIPISVKMANNWGATTVAKKYMPYLANDAVSSLMAKVVVGVTPMETQIKVQVSTSGGSGGTYQDKIDDFGLSDGSSKEVTISGSFTISFEWVFTINPELDYPNIVAKPYFGVDGAMQLVSGTIYENGVLRLSDGATVTGEGIHTLQWKFESLTSLPISCSVRNIKIVRSAKNGAASAKSAATLVPQASPQKMGILSAKAVSSKSAATLVQEAPIPKAGSLSTKAALETPLTSASNDTTLPRLYCYERYVVVRGIAYNFALSADDNATISVSGLPPGFSLKDGMISGCAADVGTTTVAITAKSSSGTTTKRVSLVAIDAPACFSQWMPSVDLGYCLPQGWSHPLVVTAESDGTTCQKSFLQGDKIYLNYAFANMGDGSAVSNFVNRFTLSNGSYFESSWQGSVLSKYGWGWLDTGVAPVFLQNLKPGTYTLKCELDVYGQLAEADEINNVLETTFTVKASSRPNLKIVSASFSRSEIAKSESMTVHWRIENKGKQPAKKSTAQLRIYDTKTDKLKKTISFDCPPLAVGGGVDFAKTLSGKTFGVGKFKIDIVADGKEALKETDKSDNLKWGTVTVTNDRATKSSSNVDWQFCKRKSSEPDSFYLSTSSSLKKKATTFKKGQKIYMRCCWWNAKKTTVSGKMRVSVYINGRDGGHVERYSWAKGYYWYFSNTKPSFLQNLPAGKYTLTAVLDSGNSWKEKNEKNNIRTISFTVVGKPNVYTAASYTCAVGESVNWPITTEGKLTVGKLPAGLKYKGGAITGKATKKGTYTVKLVSKNIKGTVTKKIKITVTARKSAALASCASAASMESTSDVAVVPEWAVGTFYSGDGESLTAITVSAAGEVSGKIFFAEETWTIEGTVEGLRIEAVMTDADGGSTAIGLVITELEDGRCRIESDDGSIWAEQML